MPSAIVLFLLSFIRFFVKSSAVPVNLKLRHLVAGEPEIPFVGL